MGFSYRRRVRAGKGSALNISKSGLSMSLGRPGSTVNASSRGIRFTWGLPGTGISYRSKRSGDAADAVMVIFLTFVFQAAAWIGVLVLKAVLALGFALAKIAVITAKVVAELALRASPHVVAFSKRTAAFLRSKLAQRKAPSPLPEVCSSVGTLPPPTLPEP